MHTGDSEDTTENDISWHDVIWENKIKLIAWIREDPSDLLDELDCKHIINREVYKQAKEINDSKKQSRFLVDHFIDSQKEDCKKFLQSLRDVKNSYHLELQDWIENIGLQEPTYGHSLTVQQSRYPQKSKGHQEPTSGHSLTLQQSHNPQKSKGLQEPTYGHSETLQQSQDPQKSKGLQEPTYGHSLTLQQSQDPQKGLQEPTSGHSLTLKPHDPQKSKGGWNKSQQDISKKFSDTKSVDTGSDRQRSVRNTINRFEDKTQTIKRPMSYNAEPSYSKEIGDTKSTSTYSVPTSQESDNARTDEQSEDQGRIKPASLGTKATHLQSVRNTINRFEDKTQTIKRPISYNAEPSYSKEIGDKKFISTSTYSVPTSQESDNARTDEQSEDQGRIKQASSDTKATNLQR
ncbi:uncharacterized protein LOC144735410 isoform X2 [Lampetra planeri]